MYKPKYRFDIIQGTPEWTELAAPRLGGSTAHVLLVNGKKREDKLGQTAVSVALENVGIILFNEYPPSFTSDAMQHGIDMEPYAREAYENETFSEVKECGYIEYGPYLGYSPDGLVGSDGLVEIKCRSAKEFLRYKLMGIIPPDSLAQMQWGLAVTGRQWCDYVNWHEQGGIIIDRVERDETLINKMAGKAPAYISLVESILDLYPRKKGYLVG